MRIKTTHEVAELIDEIKVLLDFSTKAEVLKLAINLTMFKNIKDLDDIVEDGFEVDTLIIFDTEHTYYDYIISEFYNVDKLEKKHYLNLINIGMKYLAIEFKRSKNNKEMLIYNLVSMIEEKNVSR